MKVIDDSLLTSGFLKSVEAFASRPAVEVSGEVLTYVGLFEKAAALAATLVQHQVGQAAPPLTAVFAYRSATAFVGILGTLLRGHGYVCLNRMLPPERSRLTLMRSGCSSVIVDRDSEPQLEAVLCDVQEKLLLILPDRDDVADFAKRWPQHVVLGNRDLESVGSWSPMKCSPDAIAYLLFTSGSTGTPKGVKVSHRNVRHYVDWAVTRYRVTEEDRLSQVFDMTFDVSVHDMFVAWERGACVCCPSQKEMIKPGRFIKDARLSMWFSVPSTAVFMERLGELKPGMYPNLRLSLFAGEALPVSVVTNWSRAAPNTIIENIYGPTELTIGCTAYRWDADRSLADCEHGTVPIGEPLDGLDAMIVDKHLHEVEPGVDGELVMTGPQLSLGYWREEELTARAFVIPPGKDRVFYRTGDRVRRAQSGKPLMYLGRMDNQIKILGHRVELGEIEAVIREATGVDGVVAIGWPQTARGADAIEVFLQTESIDEEALRARLRGSLPPYMVPRAFRLLPCFPLNANGKYDRRALIGIREALG